MFAAHFQSNLQVCCSRNTYEKALHTCQPRIPTLNFKYGDFNFDSLQCLSGQHKYFLVKNPNFRGSLGPKGECTPFLTPSGHILLQYKSSKVCHFSLNGSQLWSYCILVKYALRVLKNGVQSPLGPRFPIEFGHFDQIVFGQT